MCIQMGMGEINTDSFGTSIDDTLTGSYRTLSFSINPSEKSGQIEMEGKWLTVNELASYLKMGRTKLFTMAQNGEIPASKIGNKWRFDRDEINRWMKACQIQNGGRPV